MVFSLFLLHGICVFNDPHSYSRGSAVAFGGIGVLTGLLVKASRPSRMALSLCLRGGG